MITPTLPTMDPLATLPTDKDGARTVFLNENSTVNWTKVRSRVAAIQDHAEKVSHMARHFTPEVEQKARGLSPEQQHRFLDAMLSGLVNTDSNMGIYAMTPEDYREFDFYFGPIIQEYHNIPEGVRQESDWNIPRGKFDISGFHPSLQEVSMRARVARNVAGWNLPSAMSMEERLRFEDFMEGVFAGFTLVGTYHSLTPGKPHTLTTEEEARLQKDHFLFNDMSGDTHLTAGGIANHWPHGRGIWLSADKTKMVWVGEEDQLRIISIVKGSDLGEVDNSLYELLQEMEAQGVVFATHPVYGNITTCPTNLGTGKRQSILGQFPNLTQRGTNEKNLKDAAKKLGLQARGVAGEHSNMDENGTADISPSARFGVSEAEVTQKAHEGIRRLYLLEVDAA